MRPTQIWTNDSQQGGYTRIMQVDTSRRQRKRLLPCPIVIALVPLKFPSSRIGYHLPRRKCLGALALSKKKHTALNCISLLNKNIAIRKGKTIFILQRAVLLENLKVGNFWRGTKTKSIDSRGQGLRGLQLYIPFLLLLFYKSKYQKKITSTLMYKEPKLIHKEKNQVIEVGEIFWWFY